ncbi:site-specific integrase [cyanobiont of Ornithocercus magnificus]|nr:site-specific integrase [cyanobiont of Ornithocercus magnificus]
MKALGLYTKSRLVLRLPGSMGIYNDSGLELVWKRSQRRVGLEPRHWNILHIINLIIITLG